MHDDAEGDASGATARQLFGQNHRHPEVGAAAAVFGRILGTEETQFPHVLEQRTGRLLLLFPLLHVRQDLLLHEAPQRLAKELVVFGKGHERLAFGGEARVSGPSSPAPTSGARCGESFR